MIEEKLRYHSKWAVILTLTCEACGKSFQRSNNHHKKALKRGATKTFCSRQCRPVFIPKTNPCAACGKETTNPKYCSSSCSARINGTLFPKKLKYRVAQECSVCGKEYFKSTTHSGRKYCPECLAFKKTRRGMKETKVASIIKHFKATGRHPSWKLAHVRLLNRVWNVDLLAKSCAKCGYGKHVELAHIKAMSTFPKSATLGEINDPSNVIQLCRNCHWEFDHGIVTLEEIMAACADLETASIP